jgi:hypothetical protein
LEKSSQSSSRKNAMCRGALSIQHLGQKKTLWSLVFCIEKREKTGPEVGKYIFAVLEDVNCCQKRFSFLLSFYYYMSQLTIDVFIVICHQGKNSTTDNSPQRIHLHLIIAFPSNVQTLCTQISSNPLHRQAMK